MKKIKLLIAVMMMLLLCAAIFTGCGKKAEEVKQADVQAATEYMEGYIGNPVDENGNQGEWVVNLPEEFERPAVENIGDEIDLLDDSQTEESWEDILDMEA